MQKYKTIVTDYEGMQTALDSHAEQGWRLFSVTPDTWRKSVPSESVSNTVPFEDLNPPGTGAQEYSASYYLLVFQRDDTFDNLELQAVAEEILPRDLLPRYDD